MFQDRIYLQPKTAASLTDMQVHQVYMKRLPRWARGMGFGSNIAAYLQSGGTEWHEFLAEFRAHKMPVLASELPEVYADEQAGLVGSSLTGAGA